MTMNLKKLILLLLAVLMLTMPVFAEEVLVLTAQDAAQNVVAGYGNVTNVAMEDKNLKIELVCSWANFPASVTPAAYAEVTLQSITESILANKALDAEWDTITYVFEGLGSFTVTKDEICESGDSRWISFKDRYNADYELEFE
jgi:hypothetical protein